MINGSGSRRGRNLGKEATAARSGAGASRRLSGVHMISVVDNPQENRFELRIDEDLVGSLSYERDDGVVSILDVTTDPGRAGQGLGLVLVRASLDAVSAEGLRVLPVFPFVRDFIERHPVYLDLVPVEERERFSLPVG